MARDDYFYVVIIIIIILHAFSKIDFVRAASTIIPTSKDFWPVGSVTADSTPVLFAPPTPTAHTHTHTHPLYSTYTTFGGINLFYFSSEKDDDDDNRFRRRRRPW